MAQAYTSPDWSSGEGISASNLQSISNVLEGIVQGTDKAIHNFSIDNSNIVVTYVDGTIETFAAVGIKGISNVTKTSSGGIDTYTFHYTDGTTYSFDVVNGASLEVVDDLTSTSKTSALSANQGRVLDTKIYNKADKTSVTELSDLVVSAKSDISSLTTKTNKLSDDVSGLSEDLTQTKADLKAMSTMTSNEDLDYSINGNIVSADFVGYARKSKNLFNPTLQSGSKNGLTYTRNEDGTYLVSGTTTAQTSITFGSYSFESGTQYRLVGFSGNGIRDNYTLYVNGIGYPNDLGKGVTFTASSTARVGIILLVPSGTTVNMLLKPMITTDTSATYNDYEPYEPRIIKPSGVVESSVSNLIGLDTNRYKVKEMQIGDKITLVNKTSSSLELYIYEEVGASSRVDYWSVGANTTRTITLATKCKEIKWNNVPNGLAWVNEGAKELPYQPYKAPSTITLPYIPLGVGDIKDELIVYADGSGKFISRVVEVNNDITPRPTPIETELTKEQVEQILALKTFADTTYIDADGLAYEIGYIINVGKAIKDLMKAINNASALNTVSMLSDNVTVSTPKKSIAKVEEVKEDLTEEITEEIPTEEA